MEEVETQMRAGVGIRRSSSSDPLLESAPSSHCMPAVAVGEEAMEMATAGHQREVEETAVGAVKEEVVVVVVDSPEKARPMAASKGNDVQGTAARKGGGGTSSGEVVEQEQEQEQEREKGKKKKKRWSWLPDPEKRWPVQGW